MNCPECGWPIEPDKILFVTVAHGATILCEGCGVGTIRRLPVQALSPDVAQAFREAAVRDLASAQDTLQALESYIASTNSKEAV